VLSSYPNFMFNVPADQVPAFVDAMEGAKDAAQFEKVVERWGIRRSHPQFWFYFHDLSQYIHETEPVEEGVLDMNREIVGRPHAPRRVRIHLMEIDHGGFCREVELPEDVDKDRIAANYRNGMLWIELPKMSVRAAAAEARSEM